MISIRAEQTHDQSVIWEITKAAFAEKAYSGGDEQDLIDKFRSIGALSLSLVAIDGDCLVGQVSFTPAAISSDIGIWYALGPIAVVPERQGEGIGGLLIKSGLNSLQERGAWGCILTGDPRYYSRHGFGLAPEHCPSNEPEKNFMLRTIGDKKPTGVFSFHKAFYESS